MGRSQERVTMATKKKEKPMSLKQWLRVHGTEPCDGCKFNIIQRAKCTYKNGYCVRYDIYKKRFNQTEED